MNRFIMRQRKWRDDVQIAGFLWPTVQKSKNGSSLDTRTLGNPNLSTPGESPSFERMADPHGLDGQPKLPEAPSLAGQNNIYLVKSLRDYRSGAHKDDMMSLVATSLKDRTSNS
jgi:hypothetical protein